MLLLLAMGCARERPDFGPVQQLVRASMALRGVRPSLEDLHRVQEDPSSFGALIEGYLEDRRFGEAVREEHDEAWGIWSDYAPMPANGTLVGLDMAVLERSLFEAPLRLAERVVMEDRPYSEILTADWAMADEIVASAWVGIEGYPAGGLGWQPVRWGDGRPAAGILSDSMLWVVYRSAGANFHRGRAAVALRAAICLDLFTEEVPVEGGDVDFADPIEVTDAVRHDPACRGCHDLLDPVAAAFPFRDYFVLQRSTWPIAMEVPHGEDAWKTTLGIPPAWRGIPVDGLAGLGEALSRDPAFASCTARRWEAWLTERPLDEIEPAQVEERAASFVEQGESVKALVSEIAQSEALLLAPTRGQGQWLRVRPAAWSRMIEDLTGFVWQQRFEEPCCGAELGEAPLGTVNLLTDAHRGYRVLAGGVDAPFQSTPTYAPNPTFALTARSVSWRAARFAVDKAQAGEPGLLDPLLLEDPSGHRREEALQELVLRVTGMEGRDARPEVHALEALYAHLSEEKGQKDAWTAVLAALLQHPRALLY